VEDVVVPLRRVLLLIVTGCAALGALASPRAARADAVGDSIARGKAFLYATQTPDGHWEEVARPDPTLAQKLDVASVRGPQWGGRTALAIYALLTAGEKPSDPRLAKAIAWMKASEQPIGTYALSFRLLALHAMPATDEVKRLAKRDVDRLLRAAVASGLHTYYPGVKFVDLSNSQVATLGLWAAAEMGVEVPSKYWRTAEKAWQDRQAKDGTWAYAPDSPDPGHRTPHAGMTAAGVATLLLLESQLAGQHTMPAGNQSDPHVLSGVEWLGRNFEAALNFQYVQDRSLYTLYGIERAAVAGGIKRFGDVVWYGRAAQFLMARQMPDGAWRGGVDGPRDGVIETSYALLTLSYSRAPVAVAKLQYQVAGRKQGERVEGNWNQRGRDVAHLVKFAGNAAEQIYRWQTVRADLNNGDDLLDAAVLYVSGDQPLAFTDTEKAALVRFVDRGGLIVFAPDNRNKPFTESATKLGTELFPECGEWRPLPPTHPILSQQQFQASNWKRQPTVVALGNGVRELMLMLPDADAGRVFQADQAGSQPELFELMGNVILYAGGAGPRSPLLAGGNASLPKATVSRVRLQKGGFTPEPRALSVFGEWARSANLFDLEVRDADPGSEPAAPPGLLFVPVLKTTTTPLPEPQAAWLRQQVAAGGTVLLEAAGGDDAAVTNADSIRRQIWPDAESAELPSGVELKARPTAVMGSRVASRMVQRYATGGGGAVYVVTVDLSGAAAGLRHNAIPGLTPDAGRALLVALLRR
jgi:hypothetical protein